jgi:predicted NBD/HSP70 family sugar kinase
VRSSDEHVGPPVVLGLDFGGTKVAAAVVSLGGRRLGEATVATEPALGARWNLLGRELSSALDCDTRGASVPGAVSR